MAYNIYTVNNFSADFRRILDQDVQPRMEEFDNARLSKIHLGIFLSLVLLFLSIKIPVIIPVILIILYWAAVIYFYETQSKKYGACSVGAVLLLFRYFCIEVRRFDVLKTVPENPCNK